MIGKPQGVLDAVDAVALRRRSAFHEHDGQAEDACGDDLAPGRLTAGVLADDDVDAMGAQKLDFRFDGKGAAGEQIVDMGRVERRIDWIDAAHEIMVLRRCVEGLRLLPADGEEDAARLAAQRDDGIRDRADARPTVAVTLLPAQPLQPQERNAGRFSGGAGIGGNLFGEGMRRIHHEFDGLSGKIGGKPVDAAETAGAHRDGLRRGVDRAAGERKRDGEVGPARKPVREIAGFRRAAQYEDTPLVHA